MAKMVVKTAKMGVIRGIRQAGNDFYGSRIAVRIRCGHMPLYRMYYIAASFEEILKHCQQ